MRSAGDAVTALAPGPDALYVGTNTAAPGGLACMPGVVRLDASGSASCANGPAGGGTLGRPAYPAAMAVVGGELYVGLAGQTAAAGGGMCTTYGGGATPTCYWGLVQYSPSRGAWMPALTYIGAGTPAGTGSAAAPVLALRANATAGGTQLFAGGAFSSLYGSAAAAVGATWMSPSATPSPSSSTSWSATPTPSITPSRVRAAAREGARGRGGSRQRQCLCSPTMC